MIEYYQSSASDLVHKKGLSLPVLRVRSAQIDKTTVEFGVLMHFEANR